MTARRAVARALDAVTLAALAAVVLCAIYDAPPVFQIVALAVATLSSAGAIACS